MATAKAVSVGATATSIVAKNEARTLLKIQNLSAKDVYIGEDNTVTTANGIRLDPGEVWIEERTKENEDYYYWGAYQGIVASGTADLRVWEKERIRQ